MLSNIRFITIMIAIYSAFDNLPRGYSIVLATLSFSLFVLSSFGVSHQLSITSAIPAYALAAAVPYTPPAISINTDKQVYVVGQTIRISGSVFNGTEPYTQPQLIQIYVTPSLSNLSAAVYKTSVVTNATSYGAILTLQQAGKYYVVAVADGAKAWSLLTVEDVFSTLSFLAFVFGVIPPFGALILLIIKRENLRGKERRYNETKDTYEKEVQNYISNVAKYNSGIEEIKGLNLSERIKYVFEGKKYGFPEEPLPPTRPESILTDKAFEILRFICLSIIAASVIGAFALTEVEITPNAPIGLIIKPITTPTGVHNNTLSGGQWMLNIGGTASDKYSSGIQVPVNVVILGIAGGYLRFLYDTAMKFKAKRLTTKELKQPTSTNNAGTAEMAGEDPNKLSDKEGQIFYESLRDIALFFLSPLLAIAVWLVLLQGGTTSIYTLAAVSLAIGLVTREVIDALVGFVTKIVGGKDKDKDKGTD